ncbi:MAG TPA: hypothetical protein VES88_06730 [Gemmatimonadaceae bacterium]|nr:hypothetical protein [Gemmatimonadaceae bacterium]
MPEHSIVASKFGRLAAVVTAGFTSTFAIAVAAGISETEAALLLRGEIEPTDELREILETLVSDYAHAVKAVNAETMKRRIM